MPLPVLYEDMIKIRIFSLPPLGLHALMSIILLVHVLSIAGNTAIIFVLNT